MPPKRTDSGVFISNRDLLDKLEKIDDRVRAVEIKIWGILVPAGVVAAWAIKELFVK